MSVVPLFVTETSSLASKRYNQIGGQSPGGNNMASRHRVYLGPPTSDEGETWLYRKVVSTSISPSGEGRLSIRSGGDLRSRTERKRSFEKSKMEIKVPCAVLRPGGSMGRPKRCMARNRCQLNTLRDWGGGGRRSAAPRRQEPLLSLQQEFQTFIELEIGLRLDSKKALFLPRGRHCMQYVMH